MSSDPCADLSTWVAAGMNETTASFLCQNFNSQITAVNTDLSAGVNNLLLLFGTALVFFMHAGFAMLCAGAIRAKNTMNILLQTVLDTSVSALCFYILGYGFAYGVADSGKTNGFVGSGNFGLHNVTNWTFFTFQWAFAATATTIPAGCVAERFSFEGYLTYTVFISAWVYPIVVHWLWSPAGWLSAFNASNLLLNSGMIDFAGDTAVHMVGGVAGTMGAILVGPRLGRFDHRGRPVDIRGHSATLVVLGTFLLWFGWYGFNPVSQLAINNALNAEIVGRVATTTTLAAAAGGATSLVFHFVLTGAWDCIAVCNGLLVGLVAITGGCSVLEPWAAIIMGFVGALLFEGACNLWLKLKIDDPLAAGPMHGVCGAWGAIGIGFLAKEEYVQQVYSRTDSTPHGVFYGSNGKLLACQIIGVITIGAWVAVQMGVFFGILKLIGRIRISEEQELAGLDISKHGGSAYYHKDIDQDTTVHKITANPEQPKNNGNVTDSAEQKV